MLPKLVLWGGTEQLTSSRTFEQSCRMQVFIALKGCFTITITTVTYNFYLFLWGWFLFVVFPAVLMLCPSDSCSPTEEHMACTSESTVNFFGNKALLLHQENELHSNKFSSGKWFGLRDRWCGCKFTFLAKWWLLTGYKMWDCGTVSPFVALLRKCFSRADVWDQIWKGQDIFFQSVKSHWIFQDLFWGFGE